MSLESKKKKLSSKDSGNTLAAAITEVLNLMNHHLKAGEVPREQNLKFMDNIYNKTRWQSVPWCPEYTEQSVIFKLHFSTTINQGSLQDSFSIWGGK